VATVPFAGALAAHGDRPALITPGGDITYRDLADRVAAAGEPLRAARRLVMVAAANRVDAIVGYLAALSTGNPVLLAPGGNAAALASLRTAYDPDVVLDATGPDPRFSERRAESAHALHPDLALLLSTSGSTGAPKLVRLSAANLQANAESIAGYLGIRAEDRAATTLPMHYCYGLSVVNSHLLRGAGLLLTDLSVADACFWDLFRTRRGTTFAAVPYTFDLLDRVGFAAMRLPHLRYITQAGGRLAPERVRRYAELGRRDGWDLVVMYGQTEATARMAYLPPHLAASRPEAIGVPIPGGSFRLEPVAGEAPTGSADAIPDGVGELVYSGPNVMLGYARSPSDLRLGRVVDELRTGDLARRADDGLYELVGRRGRFVKVFGLRIDPQRIEARLDRDGITACCVGADDDLAVAVVGAADPHTVRRLVAAECGLPARVVRVCPVPELPRLASGKVDHAAVRDLTRAAAQPAGAQPAVGAQPLAGSDARVPAPRGGGEPDADLRALYAELLDRPDATVDSSFVSLGGDSLSYVEVSLRLELVLGRLPPGWHTMRIRDLRPALACAGTDRATRLRTIDTSVAIRAIAIVFIVGSHIDVFDLPGGAHLLIGLAGYNFARFHLTAAERGERVRHLSASIARIAVASMVWIAGAAALTGDYNLTNVLLLNEVLGPHEGTYLHFWFVEAIVYTLVVLTAVLAVPAVDRLERRAPLALPAALVAAGLVVRYDLFGLTPGLHIPTPVAVFWLFALGWAAAKATGRWHRLGLTVAVLASVPGFFGKPVREVVVIAGLCLLVWVCALPSVRWLNRVAGLLAGASLYIYLIHWQVYPLLDHHSPVLALLASLVAGIGYAAVAARVGAVRVAAARAISALPSMRTSRVSRDT
jgi:acyl-coenzyme A synthetase/AMP-(fatty) acid ligase